MADLDVRAADSGDFTCTCAWNTLVYDMVQVSWQDNQHYSCRAAMMVTGLPIHWILIFRNVQQQIGVCAVYGRP
jgi:hypothetical protein